jgi:predicted ATP-dependent endonuclease of OLD family
MYISTIHIENFRNFRIIDIPLKAFSIIIGENDSGKSNLLDAIRLVLYNNSLNYYSKVLSITDFNKEIVNEFYDYLKSNRLEINQKIGDSQYMKKIYEKIPVVCIKITFLDAQTEYQKQLLKDWMNTDDTDGICYEIEYCFMPQKKKDFIEECLFLIEKTGDFLLPVEKYDYRIYAVNNCKIINRDKAKNFSVSIINAERDTFSESDRQNSYRLVTSKTLTERKAKNE